MRNFAKKVALGMVLGATVLSAAAPSADAQRYRRGDGGGAVVAGIAGLAIGAAIASGDHRYDYDRRYYRDHGYYPTDGYYYRNYYRSGGNCYDRSVWDRNLHRRVMVRYCN